MRTFLVLLALLVIAWAVLTDLPGEIWREVTREPAQIVDVPKDMNLPPPIVEAQSREATLHPLAKYEAQTWEAVAQHIAANEPDLLQRTKAIHDHIADRIVYDVESYVSGKSPPDDPATVFSSRKSICGGYAKLFQAMATAAGIKSRFVGGRARSLSLLSEDEPHAWNIVELGGREYLLDVTWDAGHVKDRAFVQKYSTDYFLTAPEVFAISHLPDRAEDQLLATPLSREDFLWQPLLVPRFFTHGLKLRTPLRSQIPAPAGDLILELENPRGVWLMGTIGETKCTSTQTQIRCPVLRGTHRVMLFAGVERYGLYEHLGHFEVVKN